MDLDLWHALYLTLYLGYRRSADCRLDEISSFSNTGESYVPTEFSTSMLPSYLSIQTGHVHECECLVTGSVANVTKRLRSRKLNL